MGKQDKNTTVKHGDSTKRLTPKQRTALKVYAVLE